MQVLDLKNVGLIKAEANLKKNMFDYRTKLVL